MDIEKICLQTEVPTQEKKEEEGYYSEEEEEEVGVEAHPFVKALEGMEEEEEKAEEQEEEDNCVHQLAGSVAKLGFGEGSTGTEDGEAKEAQDEDEDEDFLNSSLYQKLDDTPPETMAEARERIQSMIKTLKDTGKKFSKYDYCP